MGGEKHIEVEDKGGNLVIFSNTKIDAMKKEYFYAEILQIGIKEKKSNNKKPLK